MLILHLYIEFFLIGLLAVGGGLATIPFLTDMAERTGWFTLDQLTHMVAISESTPGPLGVNMATYVGFETGGILGAISAVFGLVSPCIIIILIVAACLKKFRNNPTVTGIFYGLRPASTGLIAAAGWAVICLSLVHITPSPHFLPQSVQLQWACILLAVGIFILTHLKWTKRVHPVAWIAVSAVLGIIFQL